MRLRGRQCTTSKTGGSPQVWRCGCHRRHRMPGRDLKDIRKVFCDGTVPFSSTYNPCWAHDSMVCLGSFPATSQPVPFRWDAPGHAVHQTIPAALHCSFLRNPRPCHRSLTWQTLATPLRSPRGQTHSPPQPFPPSVGRRQALRGSAAGWDQICYDSSSSDSSRDGGGAASSSSSSGSSSQSALSEWYACTETAAASAL